MSDITSILKIHTDKYPRMQPQDAVKLLHQSEFGGGHLISDISSCKKYIQTEYDRTPALEKPIAEDIGGGMVRIYLDAAKFADISSQAIFMVFLASSRSRQGCIECFKDKLDILRKITDGSAMPFSPQELEEYLISYITEGYPIVSHSDTYRQTYSPAYRVCTQRYARLLPVIDAILKLLQNKDRIVIAIDGRAASGKSTAANDLKDIFGGELAIVHMDDFFLPLELRTTGRYAEPGGNIHYERFCDEVLSAIPTGKLNYRRFDCSICDYSESIALNLPKITAIEGSYSLHPRFRSAYDLAVFSDIDAHEQIRRIIARNGEEWGEIFKEKWIPLEEEYFSAFDIRENSDIVI